MHQMESASFDVRNSAVIVFPSTRGVSLMKSTTAQRALKGSHSLSPRVILCSSYNDHKFRTMHVILNTNFETYCLEDLEVSQQYDTLSPCHEAKLHGE